MTVLVTGGAGYIGSVTVEVLLARGFEVVVADDLRKGHRAAVDPRAAFELADVRDAAAIGRIVDERGVDAVLHFAASSLVGESMRDPHRYFRDNTAATLDLLEVLLARGVDRFVLSSTAALFGTPDRQPIDEDAPVRPESPYGESKWQIERVLHWLAVGRGLGYATLRYFNAAGASERFGEDHRPETHLVPLVLEVAAGEREAIDVFGSDFDTPDGTAVRDYVHVLDLADAHVRALDALGPGRELRYNLGNGAGYSVREVVQAAQEVTGRAVPSRDGPRRAGDPPRLVADATRIRRDLGWRPRHPDLRDILESAWAWRQRHPAGYAR